MIFFSKTQHANYLLNTEMNERMDTTLLRTSVYKCSHLYDGSAQLSAFTMPYKYTQATILPFLFSTVQEKFLSYSVIYRHWVDSF